MPFKYHHRTFPFEVSHEMGYTVFGRYTYQNMYMIRHHMPFYNFYTFPLTQIFYDLLDIFSQFFIDYFPTVLWCKNDVILAYPFRSVYKELHADRETGC